MGDATPSIAELTYDAAQELLCGTIGHEPRFCMRAYSGGSRGHKANSSPQTASKYLYDQAGALLSHLATTRETKDPHGNYVQRGGTLPPGHYVCKYLASHPTFHECIRLFRTSDAIAIRSPFSPHLIPHGRGNDFFIHGSGPKGSDGCIVPANDAARHRLNRAVKAFNGRVILNVKNVGYQLPAEVGDAVV